MRDSVRRRLARLERVSAFAPAEPLPAATVVGSVVIYDPDNGMPALDHVTPRIYIPDNRRDPNLVKLGTQ